MKALERERQGKDKKKEDKIREGREIKKGSCNTKMRMGRCEMLRSGREERRQALEETGGG